MSKEILTFCDTDIEKNKFYHLKSVIFVEDIDIERGLVPFLGEKTINTLLLNCVMIKKLNYYI